MNKFYYSDTPEPTRSIIEMTVFGYHVELFFAWFDFWIGVFYNKKKKTVYIGLLPTVIFSICSIRPTFSTDSAIKTGVFMRQDAIDSAHLDKFVIDNPQFLKKVVEDMQKAVDKQNRRIIFGYDPGDPSGDTTVYGETDGKTFREIRREK